MNKKAVALVVVLGAVLVVSIITAVILGLVNAQASITKKQANYVKGISLCEIGIKRAIWLISQPGTTYPYEGDYIFRPHTPDEATIHIQITQDSPSEYTITSSTALGNVGSKIEVKTDGSNILSWKETR